RLARLEFGKRHLDVLALLLQDGAAFGDALQEQLELARLAGRGVVHGDHLGDLLEREAEALSTQDELQTRAVARRVNTGLAAAARRQERLVLVESDGARGDVELARQLRDRVGLAAVAIAVACGGHAAFAGAGSISASALARSSGQNGMAF